MATLDWIVLGIFCMALIGIIFWVLKKKNKDTSDYFLAGRDATWIAIGASIFASNIGSEHLVGLAGAGAEWYGNGSLGNAWMVDSAVGLVIRTILCTQRGIYHA